MPPKPFSHQKIHSLSTLSTSKNKDQKNSLHPTNLSSWLSILRTTLQRVMEKFRFHHPHWQHSTAYSSTTPAIFLKSKRKPWLGSRLARYSYLRLRRLRSTPEYLARGLAAGVFAGLFPFFGIQIIIGVALATWLKGHKFLAAAGTWISNPFTYLPIYWWNFQVGQWLLRTDLSFTATSLNSWQEIMELGTEFMITLLLGSCVMGLICAAGSYWLGLWLFKKLRP